MSSQVKVPSVTLSNGVKMPALGLGTWRSNPGEVTQAVKDAIDAGYRHFDCAYVYGNEVEVGAGIKAKMDEGIIKREDIFVTSKLWNTFHRPDLVVTSCKKSLENLGLSYLDLYLIHWPMGYKEDCEMFPVVNEKTLYSEADYVDTWKSMEEVVALGLSKSLGLSNFSSEQVERVLAVAKVKPVNNQVECHPFLNQQKLINFCKARGIHLTAYAPLGSPDRPWAKPTDPQLMDDPKIKKIAEKYGKTTAHVLLRWQIQRNVIVIPKSVTKKRIQDNIKCFDFELSKDDMNEIDGFDCGGRTFCLEWVKDHPHYPFNIEY